jgi:hypothetical protein
VQHLLLLLAVALAGHLLADAVLLGQLRHLRQLGPERVLLRLGEEVVVVGVGDIVVLLLGRRPVGGSWWAGRGGWWCGSGSSSGAGELGFVVVVGGGG